LIDASVAPCRINLKTNDEAHLPQGLKTQYAAREPKCRRGQVALCSAALLFAFESELLAVRVDAIVRHFMGQSSFRLLPTVSFSYGSKALYQHIVHMAADQLGEMGSAETEPKSHAWSFTGSMPFFPTHIAPT
jgi:hypothetical protein